MKTAPDLAEAFRIGIRPLGMEDWLVEDEALAGYLAEKERLGQERFDTVFMAEPGTAAAGDEVLELIVRSLGERYPDLYRFEGDVAEIRATGGRVRLDDVEVPALWRAARLVQEDLVLLRRSGAGWRLAAAALCFPSAWRLTEKFGRPMHAVHGPVPDFGTDTRNAMLIERMFDNLRPETPVLRWNWGLYGDDALHHPGSESEGRFGPAGDALYLRRERQTLSRLPQTGDIAFTIRIFVDPVGALAARPGGADLVFDLRRQIAEMSVAQLAYKGFGGSREALLARLKRIGGDPLA